MAKGGSKAKEVVPKKRAPQSESSEEEESQIDEQDFDEDDYDIMDPEISDREEELLERINAHIADTEQEGEKLTWAAILQIKKQEHELNKKLDQQLLIIQQKYEKLKTPLYKKIANIASGQIVQKQLYSQHELTKSININKHKPKRIQGFWKQAFESAHFISGDQDAHILAHCVRVQSHTVLAGAADHEEETITVLLQFQDNPIIKNKELKAVSYRKGEESSIKELSTVEFKTNEPREEGSFIQIFNPNSTPQEIYSACSHLQRIYNNAVFHYFYETQLEDDDVDMEALENGENEDDENDDEEIKPVKKGKQVKKTENKNSGTANPIEKPNCKNQ